MSEGYLEDDAALPYLVFDYWWTWELEDPTDPICSVCIRDFKFIPLKLIIYFAEGKEGKVIDVEGEMTEEDIPDDKLTVMREKAYTDYTEDLFLSRHGV